MARGRLPVFAPLALVQGDGPEAESAGAAAPRWGNLYFTGDGRAYRSLAIHETEARAHAWAAVFLSEIALYLAEGDDPA